MNLFYCKELSTPTITLNEEESKHCARVLRMSVGDNIQLMDGKGSFATGTITSISKKSVKVSINTRKFVEADEYNLHIAVAPTKQIARIEWFVEKSIEFGVHEISFIQTKHSERKYINTDRIKKIALTAAKQSLTAYLPKINDMQPIQKFIEHCNSKDQKMIATLIGNSQKFSVHKNESVIILIGPEGGFTEHEVESAIKHDFSPVTLGHKRLRTETAALYPSTVLYHLNES